MIGPPRVPDIQATILVIIFFDPSLFSINLSVSSCFNDLSFEIGSCTNINPMFIKIIMIPKIKKVICQ